MRELLIEATTTMSRKKPSKKGSYIFQAKFAINNGKRTEWSPVRSVIVRVINKMDDRKAGVRFANH